MFWIVILKKGKDLTRNFENIQNTEGWNQFKKKTFSVFTLFQ